jgi:hypothetical protein
MLKSKTTGCSFANVYLMAEFLDVVISAVTIANLGKRQSFGTSGGRYST